ncbi:MAG TPA: 3-oxoacyl-[acyl-carrier-protein] synthase III C-terminal domain-containing protein [Terriglobia bacterium]|nr:3-oxoacyl-[acyl-carrier-protein] synthase III C-terminal domain-containing protein [Terriglobia bacterium]
MSLESDFETALATARTSVASKLSSLPKDDVDLVETGALDSMAWVDTLISIESATGIRDFGNPWPENRPKTIRSLVDMIREAQEPSPEEKPRARAAGRAGSERDITVDGWGYTLGSLAVDAEQIERDMALPLRKIRDGAGIQSVRIAADGEDELALAQRAADIALEVAKVSVERIDFLVATSTTFLGYPSFAASLHSRLLLRETSGALDVGGACAGLIYSLAVAKSLLRTSRQGVALVVAAEVHSRRLDAPLVPGEFRGLFGDGACAFVLTNAATDARDGCVRLQEFVWGCSGTFASSLGIHMSDDSGLNIQFKGEQLAHAAVTEMDRIIGTLENLSAKPRSEVDYFALHQPNPRVVEILAEKASIPLERIPLASKTCGNLGSVTCGASLCQVLDSRRMIRDQSRRPLIFMVAVAPGLLWGGAFLN